MNVYIIHNKQQSGPHSETEVLAMIGSGQVFRDDLAWKEGLPEWVPLQQTITLPPLPPVPADLPPVPPYNGIPDLAKKLQATVSRPGSATFQTVSAIIALILGVLATINIGGCVYSQHKLNTFEQGGDESSTAKMFVDTMQGMSQSDPLRGMQGLFDRHQALKDDADSSQLWAWLCMLGALLSGGMFTLSKLKIVPA